MADDSSCLNRLLKCYSALDTHFLNQLKCRNQILIWNLKKKKKTPRRVTGYRQKERYEYFMGSLLLHFIAASFILDNSETLLLLHFQWNIMYHLNSYYDLKVKDRSEYILITLLSSWATVFILGNIFKTHIISHIIPRVNPKSR